MKTLEKTGGNKFLAFLKRAVRNQIFIPLAALLILVLFNLIADPSFFAIKYAPNSAGDMVISGNIITILDNASELAILAIGMTLVTSASGGQDISVGATIAVAGSVVLRVLCGGEVSPGCAPCADNRCIPRLRCRINAPWCVQRRPGGLLQDTADGRNAYPIHSRTFHRGMDKQQSAPRHQ